MQADLLACTGEHARCPKKIKEDVSCVLAAVLLKWQPRVKMGRYDPHVLPSQGIRLGWKYVKICKCLWCLSNQTSPTPRNAKKPRRRKRTHDTNINTNILSTFGSCSLSSFGPILCVSLALVSQQRPSGSGVLPNFQE